MAVHWSALPRFAPLISCVALAALAVAAAAQEADWSGDLVGFRTRGGRLAGLWVDPTGRGTAGASRILDAGFRGIEPGPATRTERTPTGIRVEGLEATVESRLESPQATEPWLLERGSIGRTFAVPAGSFARVEARVPTWQGTDSAVTLRLRLGGPEGEVVAERRATDIRDNSWQALDFAPQPGGTYCFELSDPEGQVGCWAIRGADGLAGVPCHDGHPAPNAPLPVLRVAHRRTVGAATVEYVVAERTLRAVLSVEPSAGDPVPSIPFEMLYAWDNTGYDCTARSVPFSRFLTDAMRYMPVQQLKRWVEREGWYELTLSGHSWIEAEGTGDHDLRLSAPNPQLRWHLRGQETLLEFSCAAGSPTEWSLDFLPREDTVPDDWPRFVLPDARATEEANRFFWERALTYPPAWGPSAWYDWIAQTRFWHLGTHLDEQRNLLEGNPMTPEGYVHTWGATVGWPFPESPPYDTRHADSNARWILACWRYALWTGDRDLLVRQAERLRRAMEYQLTVLEGAEAGLIRTVSKDVHGRHQGLGNNYWDILPFGGLDAYANVVWYASLEAMAQIEEMLAQEPGAAARRAPEEYRALAARAREAYSRTFWDEDAGRFIGCVDIDGARHDYGFTFVNLEAMAYGLASPEQAARIYRWMETEPTSSGEADTYSRWIFAPRATTLHNPRWEPETGSLEPDCPREPWWMYGWRGTAFGDQCQDGGAILYTSYFDLVARTRLLSPDSAWKRWEEILGRWRMDDRLCGGPPLIRGEHPQLIDPGSTGTDMPFPESGMVPCWLLHAAMGVQPTPEGLVIAPRLPGALPWIEVRNLAYRGLPMDLRVTPSDVTLRCRAEGYEFTWTRGLGADGRVVFREPPAPVRFPEEPLSAGSGQWKAHWIWGPDPEAEEVWLRGSLVLADTPRSAWLTVTADNTFELYVNGERVGAGDDAWQTLHRFDLSTALRAGENVIALHGGNLGGPAGLLAEGRAELPDGSTAPIRTGADWRAAPGPLEGWAAAAEPAGCVPVADLGAPPVQPWGRLDPPVR